MHLVSTNDLAENWLNKMIIEMQQTQYYEIKRAIYKYGKEKNENRIDWIGENLGSVCLAASNVWWTTIMEETFRIIEQNRKKDAMKLILKQKNDEINELMAKGICRIAMNQEQYAHI